mmetsp:Transcript_11032/g.45799  ORF Transcript_11032/g.45799 Transcript_11032/m.45799 type:complete len:487 (+) Transcript_11032:53-1513(+)
MLCSASLLRAVGTSRGDGGHAAGHLLALDRGRQQLEVRRVGLDGHGRVFQRDSLEVRPQQIVRLEQRGIHAVERLPPLEEQRPRLGEAVREDANHCLLGHGGGGLVRAVRRALSLDTVRVVEQVGVLKGVRLGDRRRVRHRRGERQEAEVTHAQAVYHVPRSESGRLKCFRVGRGGALAKHEALRRVPSQVHRHALAQPRLSHGEIVVILAARKHRAAEEVTLRHEAHALHRLHRCPPVQAQRRGNQRTPRLAGGDALLDGRQPRIGGRVERLLAEPHRHAVERRVNVARGNLLRAPPDRHQGRFVQQIGQVGAREPAQVLRQLIEVDVGGEGLVARVHLQDLRAPGRSGLGDVDLAVEAPRAQKRGVEHVRAVRGAHEDHARFLAEAIHLGQQLVERLLTLLRAAALRLKLLRGALAAQGVELVHEDDARRVDTRALEQIAHARGAHAHDGLHELRARHGEERHARLTGNGLCNKRFAHPWRPLK